MGSVDGIGQQGRLFGSVSGSGRWDWSMELVCLGFNVGSGRWDRSVNGIHGWERLLGSVVGISRIGRWDFPLGSVWPGTVCLGAVVEIGRICLRSCSGIGPWDRSLGSVTGVGSCDASR